MKFRYDGPFDEVEVPDLGEFVKHGHQVEATGAVAESLEKQTDWTRVDRPKPKKRAAKKTTAKKTTPSAPAPTDTPPPGDDPAGTDTDTEA